MKNKLEPLSFKKMLAGFLQQILDADIAMQLNQINTWREAAKLDPLLDGLGVTVPRKATDGQVEHVITNLIEGIDRLNNLAIGEVTLEFDLESTPPPLWKRIWSFIHGISIPKYYRMAPPLRSARTNSILTVTLKAKRRPLGAWEVTSQAEKYPKDLDEAILPKIF